MSEVRYDHRHPRRGGSIKRCQIAKGVSSEYSIEGVEVEREKRGVGTHMVLDLLEAG